MNLTWRDVLNCKKQFGDIEKFFLKATEVGYNYFAWNSHVYEIYYNAGEITFRSIMLIEDLK